MKSRLALCCFLSAAALAAVAQPEYRVTVLHSFRVPFEESFGWGIGGGQQVGDSNNLRSGGSSHALLWSGTPESLVDLHPSGWDASFATGVAGGWQAGWVNNAGNGNAALWNGSVQSFVNLNPAGMGSVAFDTNGYHQVGYTARSGGSFVRAARWSGSAESYFDLHQFLPAQFQGQGAFSQAYAIDAEGNIIGYARDLQADGAGRAVMWSPVPEPGTVVGLSALLALLAARRRRAHVN